MEEELSKQLIAKRAAREFSPGEFVNLGIGLPTMIPAYLPEGVKVILHSEVGLIGTGGPPEVPDFNICDAGGAPAAVAPGGAFVDSALSFGLIRGGHIDTAVLGGFQVDEAGNLANWIVPGKSVAGMGGAMDLCAGARRIIVVMEHTRKGEPKIVKECTLPLTGRRCVTRIITEMAVIDITGEGLVLREVNPAFTVEEVRAATGAALILPGDGPEEMKF